MEKQTQQKKKSRSPIIIMAIVLLLMAGAGGYYWIQSGKYATTDNAVLDGDIYAVKSSVTAYLDRINFVDNQRVQKGDTLFVFDTTALKASVAQAQSALEQAKSKLSVSDLEALVGKRKAQSSQQSILSLKDQVTAAKTKLDKAQADFDRNESLLKIDAITQAQFDADASVLELAKASYQQALHNQQSSESSSSALFSQAAAAQGQISTALAMVAQREAELALAQENLKHAYVLAPCDGIVSKRAVNPGQYTLAGQSLCTITDTKSLWVSANFKETELKNIQTGQAVEISVDAYPDLKLKGVVESLGGATGSKFALIPPDNATGNFIKVTQLFPLRIKITDFFGAQNKPNGRDKDFILFPGLSAYVKINIK